MVRDMSDAHAKALAVFGKELIKLSNIANDDSDLPAPRRPGRPKKNNSDAAPAKRGRGRPRKSDENDDEEVAPRGGKKNAAKRGRPRNEDSEKPNRKTAKPAAKSAAP